MGGHGPSVSAACAALAIAFGPALAAAAEPTLADDLFLQGKALLQQGLVGDACEKFARSLELARRGGTLLNLAVCREQQGLSATALRLFADARAQAIQDGRADRVALADQRVQSLSKTVSWLTITPNAERPAGLVILLDEAVVPESDWGAPQAVDPGEHQVRARAPGYQPSSARILVGTRGDRQGLTLAPLERAVAPMALAPTNATAQGTSSPASLRGTTVAAPVFLAEPKPASASHTLRFVTLGVGAAAFTTGVVSGVAALIQSGKSHSLCPARECSSDEAFRANDRAKTWAAIADVTLPAGAAVAAAALWLWPSRAAAGHEASKGEHVFAGVGRDGLNLQWHSVW